MAQHYPDNHFDRKSRKPPKWAFFKALLGGDDDDLLARLDSFASKIKGFSYFALYEAIRKAHRPTLGGDLLVRTRQAARQHPAPTRSDALTDQAGTAA